MMNLEKMKQKKRTNTKSRVKKSLLAATTFLCLTTPLLQTQTAYAAENTTPAITIEKPDGWKQGETTIAVTVDASHMPEGFSIAKIEAKAGKDGSWQDVTGNCKSDSQALTVDIYCRQPRSPLQWYQSQSCCHRRISVLHSSYPYCRHKILRSSWYVLHNS